ncbi:MAG: hypothetical protein M1819_005139 [Sarea resinae]|nr:MAG: hypothetical protein M1819_005139 [Sarea resinae]
MSEFIGARISLVSKSDIRYVGTLHEINSEKSTVALEQVISFGTEGRRNSPEDEIAPSDSVYEYIVFRGSDVKDLRIEEPPKENEPPQLLNDPAILGSGSRPQHSPQPSPQQPQQQERPRPPQLPQQPPFPYYYPPPPNQRFGPQGGFPGAPGFPPLPYGAPPGWYPPPGQGFPHPPGPFQSSSMPPMPPGPTGPKQAHQQPRPIGPSVRKDQKPESLPEKSDKSDKPGSELLVETSSTLTSATSKGPTQKGPPLPVDSKPDVATALAPAAPATITGHAPAPSDHASVPSAPTRLKNGRIIPAVPLANTQAKPPAASTSLQANSGNTAQRMASQPGQAAANAALEYQNATEAATAAVAAAMAKLPPAPSQHQQGEGALDNLTKKVNEMRTKDLGRTARQPGVGAHGGHYRGGVRGNFRGGPAQQHAKRVEVPTTDFDFESANAKFNKQDLVKEAIATGSPVGTPEESAPSNINGEATSNGTSKSDLDAGSTTTPYNRSSSFFDNISSESKDRDEANGRRPGGREWRGEEQKKNLETFGQGSVDSGYRGGYRGRGRGRGAGRGRGGFGGPGSYRGQRAGHRGNQGSSMAGNPAVNAQS